MEALDYWRLCDELSVVQAALLIVGKDPGPAQTYVENWDPHERPAGYDAAKAAVSNALKRGTLKGKLIPLFDEDINGNRTYPIEDSISPHESSIDVLSLKPWLQARGIRTGFFFPQGIETPDYLDRSHSRYAPKLAAAVKAWLAVDDSALGGKHPKQALTKWLREHAAEYQLADDEGKPNEKGIEETAKVANWKQSGGAPTTPNEDPF